MEVLVFAMIAIIKLYRPEEKFVPELHEFQPFDVQMLKHVYNAKGGSSHRSSDRQKSYAIQAV